MVSNPFYTPPSGLPGKGQNFRQLVDRKTSRKPSLSIRDGDWQRNAQLLADSVDRGLGVLLARTQDGGAISMTVYQGQNRYRSYASNDAELDELFEALGEHAKGG